MATRKTNEVCRKCGAVVGEWCKHSSSKKPEKKI